jgi:hypothetical protein
MTPNTTPNTAGLPTPSKNNETKQREHSRHARNSRQNSPRDAIFHPNLKAANIGVRCNPANSTCGDGVSGLLRWWQAAACRTDQRTRALTRIAPHLEEPALANILTHSIAASEVLPGVMHQTTPRCIAPHLEEPALLVRQPTPPVAQPVPRPVLRRHGPHPPVHAQAVDRPHQRLRVNQV